MAVDATSCAAVVAAVVAAATAFAAVPDETAVGGEPP